MLRCVSQSTRYYLAVSCYKIQLRVKCASQLRQEVLNVNHIGYIYRYRLLQAATHMDPCRQSMPMYDIYTSGEQPDSVYAGRITLPHGEAKALVGTVSACAWSIAKRSDEVGSLMKS